MRKLKQVIGFVILLCSIHTKAQIYINTGNEDLKKHQKENPNTVVWGQENSKTAPAADKTSAMEPATKTVMPAANSGEAKKPGGVKAAETKKPDAAKNSDKTAVKAPMVSAKPNPLKNTSVSKAQTKGTVQPTKQNDAKKTSGNSTYESPYSMKNVRHSKRPAANQHSGKPPVRNQPGKSVEPQK